MMKSLQKMITREENTILIKAHIPCQYCGSSDAGAPSDGFIVFLATPMFQQKEANSVEADEVVKDIISYVTLKFLNVAYQRRCAVFTITDRSL